MARRLPIEVYSTLNPMSADELEAGLRELNRAATNLDDFWDDNIVAFRQTVLAAICETSNALSIDDVPWAWAAELNSQLALLREYLALADRYLCSRTLH